MDSKKFDGVKVVPVVEVLSKYWVLILFGFSIMSPLLSSYGLSLLGKTSVLRSEFETYQKTVADQKKTSDDAIAKSQTAQDNLSRTVTMQGYEIDTYKADIRELKDDMKEVLKRLK